METVGFVGVGKIGMPDALLQKDGALSREEFAIIQEHVLIGDRIVSSIRQFDRLRPGVRSHHEQFDGNGYPDRLASDQIPESSPTLSVAISCVGRRLVLGERTDEELEATLEVLPKGTRQIGFYSYGEISPYASGYCDLHNQTMTLTTISEM